MGLLPAGFSASGSIAINGHAPVEASQAGLLRLLCLLLPAERAADLGPRRADIDVGDAAVRAFARDESLGLAHVEREDRGGQTSAHRVLDRDRLVQ
eukprot:gene50078-68036_t